MGASLYGWSFGSGGFRTQQTSLVLSRKVFCGKSSSVWRFSLSQITLALCYKVDIKDCLVVWLKKQSSLSTVSQVVKVICNHESELDLIQETFCDNSCSTMQSHNALNSCLSQVTPSRYDLSVLHQKHSQPTPENLPLSVSNEEWAGTENTGKVWKGTLGKTGHHTETRVH
jgi:hypothetical protein